MSIPIDCAIEKSDVSAEEFIQHELKIDHSAQPLRASWSSYGLDKGRRDFSIRRAGRRFECGLSGSVLLLGGAFSRPQNISGSG